MTMSNGQRISVKFIAELVGLAIVFAAIIGSYSDSQNKISTNARDLGVVKADQKKDHDMQTQIRLDQREIRTDVRQMKSDIREIKDAVK